MPLYELVPDETGQLCQYRNRPYGTPENWRVPPNLNLFFVNWQVYQEASELYCSKNIFIVDDITTWCFHVAVAFHLGSPASCCCFYEGNYSVERMVVFIKTIRVGLWKDESSWESMELEFDEPQETTPF